MAASSMVKVGISEVLFVTNMFAALVSFLEVGCLAPSPHAPGRSSNTTSCCTCCLICLTHALTPYYSALHTMSQFCPQWCVSSTPPKGIAQVDDLSCPSGGTTVRTPLRSEGRRTTEGRGTILARADDPRTARQLREVPREGVYSV